MITTLASDWTRLESVCYRFGVFLGLAHAAMTAEGDNSVLMQKVAKEHLAKMVKNPPKVSAPANNSVSNPDHLLYLLKVILASHWSIFLILASHWSKLLILASHWSILKAREVKLYTELGGKMAKAGRRR